MNLWKAVLKRHKHTWEKTSEVEIDSLFDRFSRQTAFPPVLPGLSNWAYQKKIVTFYRCECGKKRKEINVGQ